MAHRVDAVHQPQLVFRVKRCALARPQRDAAPTRAIHADRVPADGLDGCEAVAIELERRVRARDARVLEPPRAADCERHPCAVQLHLTPWRALAGARTDRAQKQERRHHKLDVVRAGVGGPRQRRAGGGESRHLLDHEVQLITRVDHCAAAAWDGESAHG